MADMRLEGWNSIPDGYGASFDVHLAPLWLRVTFRTPFVDRFAYPLLIDRGLGYLRPHPGWGPEKLGPVPSGWKMRPDGWEPPGATSWLK